MVPIFKRLKFNFCKNLSAVFSNFENIPANKKILIEHTVEVISAKQT